MIDHVRPAKSVYVITVTCSEKESLQRSRVPGRVGAVGGIVRSVHAFPKGVVSSGGGISGGRWLLRGVVWGRVVPLVGRVDSPDTGTEEM